MVDGVHVFNMCGHRATTVAEILFKVDQHLVLNGLNHDVQLLNNKFTC